MLRLVLIFAMGIMEYSHGRPPRLPPLPMKEGCYLVSPEVMMLRVEGEAIILSFPMFMRVLEVRKIANKTAKYSITKHNGTEGVHYNSEGRVQQHDKQLWFLPAQASDSGAYICTFRNETYCVTGSITLNVYQTSSVEMDKLSYPISATVGQELIFSCPQLSDFNQTDRLIEWHKESDPNTVQKGRAASFSCDDGDLKIPAVKRSHAGVYTCQLRVLINNQEYKVSRAVLLHVQGLDPVITTTEADPSMTSDPGLVASNSAPVNTPVTRPPVILSPLNGTIFEGEDGSGLELVCKVITDCQSTDSTLVTWWVNGQSVESSYLDSRALQGGRRVARVSQGCQIEMRLVIVSMTEEDSKTELRCVTQNQGGRQEVVVEFHQEDSTFTWLVVAAVAASCFLTVVSVFLYILFKPKRKEKMDYFLARQNSTF